MDNVLCGHILAARKSVPWLYVLPISEILQEVKDIMSCRDITLPQHHPHFDLSALTNSSVDSCSNDSTVASISTIASTECGIHSQHMVPAVIDHDQSSVMPAKPIVGPQVKDIISACLGSLHQYRAGSSRLDYTAFEKHCLSCLTNIETTTYKSVQDASHHNADVFDILQMIKTGLHRDELVDTLEQRADPESMNCRFVQERVDRVASLLVMTEIGNFTQNGYGARISWRSGTLQQLINSHFSRERTLTDTSIRLEQIFTAKSLVKITGLRIIWTANLSDHLAVDRKQNTLHIFHHATYLECQRKRCEQNPFHIRKTTTLQASRA